MDKYTCLACDKRLPDSGRDQHEKSSQHIENMTKFNNGGRAPTSNRTADGTHATTAAPTTWPPYRASMACNSIDAPRNQRPPKQFKKNKQKTLQPNFKKRDAHALTNFVVYNSAYQDRINTSTAMPNGEVNSDSAVGNEDPVNENTSHKQYTHKLFITGYAPYVRANDLLHACARFGPAQCERRTVHAAVLAFADAEHAEAAVRAAARGLLFVYGAPLTARYYVPGRDQVAPPKQKEKPLAVPPEELQLSGEFQEQAEALLARVRLTRDQVERLVALYADVERALSTLWPYCRAVPFGSITTGLGIKGSDADCFVEVPGGAPANAVNRARRPLQQMSQVFLDVVAIPRASTPIVKLLHVPTNTKCDLSFKTPRGVFNSRLLAHLLHRAPVLPRLAVLLKYWAGVHGLSGTGRLSNYSLVLLLTHYLQRREPPILPPVEALQRNPAFIFIVDNWNTGFDERAAPSPHLPRDEDLPDLLGGFFEYYAAFEFERYIVSPYLGGPLPREAFTRPEALPDEFAIYRRNVLEDVEPALRVETPWCVQDPFVHCHNVASGVNTQFASELIAYIRYAAAAYGEERANGHRDFLRRLLLERPQLARRATIALFSVRVKPQTLKAAGHDWRNRVRRATADIFEGIFGATLHDRRYVEGDEGRQCDESTARFERYLWRQRKQRRLRGAADLPFLERELATSAALRASSPLMPPVSLRLVLKLGPTDTRAATVSVRLLEGDVVAFRDFGNYFMSVYQSWYAKLLGLNGEPSDRNQINVEPGADEAPLAAASDNEAGGYTKSEDSDAGSSDASSPPATALGVDPLAPPSPPPPEDTIQAHYSDSPTNPPLKILKMNDMNHVEQ